MSTVPQKAKIECIVRCGVCGRTETEIYVNTKSIASLKARSDDWVFKAKKGYNVCPECYAQRYSRKRRVGIGGQSTA